MYNVLETFAHGSVQFQVKEVDVEDQLLPLLEQELTRRLEKRFGCFTLHFDECEQEGETTLYIIFTLSRDDLYLARMYGWATYQNNRWYLDVRHF